MNAIKPYALLAALSTIVWSCASSPELHLQRSEPAPEVVASLHANAAPANAEAATAAAAELEEPADSPPFCRPPRPLVDDGKFYVLGPDAEHPFVRYLDGQVSLNATCAIRRGNKLSRKVPPVYVNGRPIGFC